MCILLSDCTKTVVIRLTNKRAQIVGSINDLDHLDSMMFQKNESLDARKEN